MVASTVEKIQIILQTVTSGFAKGLERTQTQLKSVGKNMQNFGAVMQMPMQNFKEINGHMKVMQNVGGKVAKRFRMMTHGMRGFRMEALGVMFFGMMMQRMFMGLLQPVMEAFGVFEIFRLMLLTLFLPVMEMIFPFLMSMMEWFMNLPDPVKKAIGIFVVLGAIFATVLMVIGQFALGIGSLIQFFPMLGGVIKAVGVVIAGLGGAVIAVIAIIIAVAIGIFVAFKENFMNIKLAAKFMIDGFKRMFKGLIDWFATPFRIIAALIRGDFTGAWDAIKRGFMGMVNFIIGLLQGLYFAVTIIAIGLFRVFKWLWDMIVKGFNWLRDKLVGRSIIPDMINAIIKWFWKIPNVIKSVVRFVGNAFIGVGNTIINVWNKVMGAISKAIITVLRGVDVVIGVLNRIPGINIGGYSWNISWGKIPSIPRLAGGGIINKPTLAMLGEEGPEAVVPLNKDNFQGAAITQENNFYGFTMDDLRRELDDRDRRLVDDIRRLVKE